MPIDGRTMDARIHSFAGKFLVIYHRTVSRYRRTRRKFLRDTERLDSGTTPVIQYLREYFRTEDYPLKVQRCSIDGNAPSQPGFLSDTSPGFLPIEKPICAKPGANQ